VDCRARGRVTSRLADPLRTEHFQLMITSATSSTFSVIATGVFTAGGAGHSGNKVDTLVFPTSSFKITHQGTRKQHEPGGRPSHGACRRPVRMCGNGRRYHQWSCTGLTANMRTPGAPFPRPQSTAGVHGHPERASRGPHASLT
jgi:hypothetical protein